MRAVVFHQTGGPEVLKVEDVELPEPGDGEVLIRVRAASVNPIDWKVRRGMSDVPLPSIPGRDASGTVEESNDGRFSVGDDVFGSIPSSYAEYATAPGDAIAKKPAELSYEQAATIPVAGLTVWQSLFDQAGLERGQSALISGAAGGVGHFATQFAARVAGARTIGTASSHNRDFVLGLGADEFIDYTQQNVAEAASDVDVALDTVGADVTAALTATLAEGGVIVTIASAPPEDAARRRGARALLHMSSPNPDELTRIADLVLAGEVRIEISETMELEDAARAQKLSEGGHVRGKIVLSVESRL
jgi:NADPH:quinone reductase-like Zn-dependent oxidoreductase